MKIFKRKGVDQTDLFNTDYQFSSVTLNELAIKMINGRPRECHNKKAQPMLDSRGRW